MASPAQRGIIHAVTQAPTVRRTKAAMDALEEACESRWQLMALLVDHFEQEQLLPSFPILVRRCKLDPSLKAHRFQNLILKRT